MIKHNLKMKLLIVATILFSLLSKPVFSQTNWFKVGSAPDKYEMLIDSSNKHEEKNVVVLKSTASDINGFGALMQNMKPEKYLGKRVRMTGYLKSQDVADWTGFWFRVDAKDSQQPLAFDNMFKRQIKGTTNWSKYEIVLDVPGNASNIAYGALLNGTGQIWINEVNFEIVDNSVPVTGK